MSCLLCLALATAPVQAGDIVVTGQARTEEEVRREARDYVRKIGVAKGETPAARWTKPVCPKVFGTAPAIAARVEARVRSIAEAAGIKTAAADCKTNIAIAFVSDGAAFARSVKKKSFRQLSEVPMDDRRDLFEGTAPVRWWYGTQVRSADGGEGNNAAVADLNSGEGGQSALANAAGGAPVFTSTIPSLVGTYTQRTIGSATVAVDVNRSTGTSLDAVADYAAFVALAEIDPPKVAPPQSVLGLFAGASDGLTDRDRDFLAALYEGPLNRQAFEQRNALTGRLVRKAQEQAQE